ncbi:MAG TPA: DegT/DnrJ/EryC1/StrS family aminotransferase [bacterium]|nr:DegT/DnrJ/EryC1/StrS family aminotransferase [bacterium]
MEFYLHNLDDADINEVVQVLKSPFLTTGNVTKLFEERFSEYLKVKDAVGVTSCTAALHLGILACDIGAGDEVITTPLSFVATSNAILHTGAKPIFVDIDEETGNINIDLIEEKITNRTKAIIPVHLYGNLCDMKKLSGLAKKYNLKIISDCAHSLESERDGYNSAAFCDVACYSFYATKNLTSGEGGAAATNDEQIADRLRILRLHGMSKSAIDRYTKKYEHYDVIEIGWKYNMDNIHAALLVNQIYRLGDLLAKRKKLYEKYINALSDIKSISFPKIEEGVKSAYHLFVIKVNDYKKRDYYLKKIQDENIPIAVNFNPIHLMTAYRKLFGYKEGDFPAAEKFGASVITLPFYVKLSKTDINFIIEKLHKIFND